jgi:hypothetical protein
MADIPEVFNRPGAALMVSVLDCGERLLSVLEEWKAANNPIPMYEACHVAGVSPRAARVWLLVHGVRFGPGGWQVSSRVLENHPSPYNARLKRIFKVV